MTYKEFESKAVMQDARNKFSTFDKKISIVPDFLSSFYQDHNPIDVEIRTEKYGAIHFYGADDLVTLKKEYYFYPENVFIFATCNGDPFFIGNDTKIYTSLASEYSPEFVADCFMDFLELCIN